MWTLCGHCVDIVLTLCGHCIQMNDVCSNPNCDKISSKVICTNCKITYCSAKCKKENKKHTCVFKPSEPTVVQPQVVDFITLNTERKTYQVYLPHELQPIVYPDGITGRLLTTFDDKPCISDRHSAQLFGTLFEKNREIIKIGDKKTGYIQAQYDDFVDFARAVHANDVSAYCWVDDTADSAPTITMDKNGRGDGILFGRLIIGGGKYLKTCVKLDL